MTLGNKDWSGAVDASPDVFVRLTLIQLQISVKNHSTEGCDACGNSERRRFIQSAVSGVAALIGLSVLDISSAVAQISAVSIPADGMRGITKYPLPIKDGVSIDSANEVMIARSANNVYAFALSCPHQNTALKWLEKDHRFQCPKHKSRYSASGEFQNGRATRNMDRFPISLDGSVLSVDSSREIRSDEEAARWAAAFVRVPA